ncbi:hypothetical protein RJ639_040389 [Escallonia herrerae]|uniref:Serpin domain-containing protein n=1 Tax=Escallonia herrerae TaxID=1293975 RepID=A0AA88WFG0_9ASTE|nr:hypothetical protein RJ639_040389 [Escallonia herrerae]
MDFSVEVAKHVLLKEAESGSNNIMFSPLSLTAMLNIQAAGSKGHTLQQLLGFLGYETIADIDTKFSNLRYVAASEVGDAGASKSPLVKFVHGAWVDLRYTLKPSFEKALRSVFRATIKALDFANKADEAKEELDLWVSDATNGLIQQIGSHVGNDTQLLLINALYFKGVWQCPFDESETCDRDFYLLNGEKIQVPFMCPDLYQYQYYKSCETYKVAKLPYSNSHEEESREFSMYVFLPNEKDGLLNLLRECRDNPEFFTQHLELPSTAVASFFIPKFEFKSRTNVSQVMHDLRLNVGEFTEMIDCPIHAATIFQTARIIVNEEGTEAAVVSEDDMGFSMYSPPRPPSFVADHPFLFMIKEDTSGTPFFIGAVVNPLLV